MTPALAPALGEALTRNGAADRCTCFVLAAAVRIIQGSATVACLTAVPALVMPVIEQLDYSGAQIAALSICIMAARLAVSHVNDAGWLFGKFTGAE
ncbi:hypothetical protein MJ575_27545 [Klebsiella pneumoniae]|nr:hypothetical protein MJ575_27545 [Klebsiella pneumoniae]